MKEIIGFLKSIPDILEEKRVVLAIIDGLGTTDLHIPCTRREKYYTVFPPTTAAFLYTLHSLLRPEEHGFLEWYMRFRDTVIAIPTWKDVINGKKLELDKDVSREDVFPFKSLSEILTNKGFSVVYYTPYASSTFTKAVSNGALVKEIKYLSQVFPLREADFILIYWPSIDVILHERFEDEAFRVEIEFIELFIKLLIERLPRNTVLYILSDHGLTLCRQQYLLPVIDSCLPVGGSRIAFYKDVDLEVVVEKIRENNIPALVYRLDELEYFIGNMNPRCYKNYGDIAVLASRDTCFQYPFEEGEKRVLGVHGGMSSRERIVNLYVYERRA